MPVDNELYNDLSDTWWDENGPLGILRTWFNPVRFGYFQRVLTTERQIDPQGLTLLDVGCGGGLLAEEFASLGCQVTGIDPSELSLKTARAHARQTNLSITYQQGTGEHLPFSDESFDIVICCDVLEHVDDVSQIIREIARVLKPGGIFFYDTINRTPLTWFATIKLAQEWKMTRFMPPNLHDWHKFIKPAELMQILQKSHLQQQQIKGISPRAHPAASFILFVQQNRGKITLTEMGKRLHLQESRDLSTSYMGYALK